MAPRKGPRAPSLTTVYNELEKSLSFNCAAVLDAATAQIGDTTLPLIAGITSKNDLWTVLHKYKTVCFSLESRLALLSVVSDFCLGSAATPTITNQDSNPHNIHVLFDKLGKEWDYLFQAVNSLPTSRRLQECKIKSVHSIFSRWAALVHSSLMNKLQSKASEICFKTYGLEPLKRGALNCNKYAAEEYSPNKENEEAPALLNIKLEMKRLCLGSLQLNKSKDQLLQLYLGEEVVLGIQQVGKQEIGTTLRKEHLDGIVVYLGDDESDSGIQDKLFLYPNSSGCRVIMEALAQVIDGCPPSLALAQGEERRVLVHFKRKVKEEIVENVVALLRRLVGNNMVEVDQEVAEAIFNKRKKASRLFSSGAKENKREREAESAMSGKAAKVMKQNGDQNRKPLESIENVTLSCFKCGFDTSDRSALNAHILTHFIKEFLKMLPGFSCPQCHYKNIDRNGLAYHYAFVHLKILDFISVEQWRGLGKVKKLKENTGISMQGDHTVTGIKDVKKNDCGIFSITKMTSFSSTDSDSDNSDDSLSSLPDIDRKSPSPEPEVPLTVTGKLVRDPDGTRVLEFRGLNGIDLNPQQMSLIKQTMKQEFSKQKAFARQQDREPPTKLRVSFPEILIRASQTGKPHQQKQSTIKHSHQEMQQPKKVPLQQIEESNRVLPQQKQKSYKFSQQQLNKPKGFQQEGQKHNEVMQQHSSFKKPSYKVHQQQTQKSNNAYQLQSNQYTEDYQLQFSQSTEDYQKKMKKQNQNPNKIQQELYKNWAQQHFSKVSQGQKVSHQVQEHGDVPQNESRNGRPPTAVTDLEVHPTVSVQQTKLQQKEPQDKSLGVVSSSKAMTETEENYTNLPCGLVRIGSYPVSPQDNKVVIHENCLEMLVADVFQDAVVSVRIDLTEIQSALVSFNDALPLLVLHLTPVSCTVLMEILGMNQKKKFATNQGVFCTYSNSRIDSNSKNETQKRIIFCLEKISKDAEKALRNFLKEDVTELQETEAKELLRRSGHVIIKDTRLEKLVSDKAAEKEILQSDQNSVIQNKRQKISKSNVTNENKQETKPFFSDNNQSPTIFMENGCKIDRLQTRVVEDNGVEKEPNKSEKIQSQEKNTVREVTKSTNHLEKKMGKDKRHRKGAQQKRN